MTLTEEQRVALVHAIDYINETDLPVGELDGFDREVLRNMVTTINHGPDVMKMIELLAAGEHDQWADWAQAILDSEPGLSDGRKAAWPEMIATPYENLSEELKDKDRREVRLRSGVALDHIQQQSIEIERLRAENEEALESLTAAYLLGRHEKAQEVAARPKEGKIDSSEHVTEPTKMIGFDLEKARAEVATASARRFSESREQARIFCAEEILPDALDEIERLRADLEQAEICIQARLDVIDQQATLIKSLKKEIRRLKHESKVEQEFTNSYIKHLHEAEARIKELESSLDEAEALTKKNAELMNGYLGRIKVLEKNCIYDPEDGKIFVPDGHPEIERLRARVVALEDALVEYLAADIAYAAGVLWSRLGPRKEEYRERARQQLQAGGKIGTGAGIASSDHIVEADQTVGGRRCHI